MINFSPLNTLANRKLTIEEKFIVQNLLYAPPTRQKDIADNLIISRYGVQQCTDRLINDGILVSYENAFGITVFTVTELTLTSMGLTSTSTGLTSTSTGLTPTSMGLTPTSTGLTPTSTGLTSTSTGLTPSPAVSPRKERKTPIVNLTLTKPNVTNRSDSTENHDSVRNSEISLTTQANAPATQESSQVPTLGILEGKAGSTDVPTTTSVPAAPSPTQAPQTPPQIDYNDFVAQTTHQPPKPNAAPPAQSTPMRMIPESTSKKLAERRKQQAAEKQQVLFNIIQNQNREGVLFLTDTPTDSLYIMIDEMKGKTVPDPTWTPKTLTAMGLPESDEKCPMIPMYDAFAKYILILWELLYSQVGNKVNDFVLHRAAYIFVTELHKKTGVCWHSPETFVEYCYEKKPKAIWNPMLGQLKDVYESCGLGWDETLLKNSETYKAEIDFAECWSEKVRSELFLAQRNSKGFVEYKANKRKEHNAQVKAEKDREARDLVQRKLNLEAERQKKADEKALQTWQGHQKYLDDLAKQSKAEREKCIDAFNPEMMKVTLDLFAPEQAEQMIEMMTPAQRKRFGLETKPNSEMKTMKNNFRNMGLKKIR